MLGNEPMNSRSSMSAFRALLTVFSFAAVASLTACSGESDTADDDDESGGSGSGGSTGSGGTGGVAPECEMQFGPTNPAAFIDDMEDGDPLIATVAGRNGSWWVTSDGTAEGTITPVSGAAPPPERILGKRCESEYGMRITGQGFTGWGANISITFAYDAGFEPIDVSAYRGVMFWAKVGETHRSPVRIQFMDSNTHPDGGVCDATPGSAEECYNGWGIDVVPISTAWRLYQIDFSTLSQRAFGYRAEAFDPTAVFILDWAVMQNTVFDLWIDDVWFYE